jgi:hypothetical protein
MKRSLIIASAFVSIYSFSQNTLPNNGKVGIGTTTPTEYLEVKGNIKVDSCVIIRDSLIVEKDGHIGKDFLVEGNSIVKGEITGYNGLKIEEGNTKLQNNLRVEKNVKVLGNQRIDGFLRLPNLNENSGNNLDLLLVNGGGKVFKSGSGFVEQLSNMLYQKECFQLPDGTYPSPTWRNKPGVVYVGAPCPPDARVGIRTQHPDAVLQVNGNAHFNKEAWFDSHVLVKDYLKVGGASIWLGNADQSTGSDNNIYATGGDLFLQSNNNLTHTRINAFNSGSVVIGNIPSPEHKLEVAGTIRACKLIAEANAWCDYVFDPSYQLRSLYDVKSFIQKNHHLPEVPSTKEIEETGVDVVEMETILLKKVEELTLYMIELNEKNDKLQKEIEELKLKMEKSNK